MTPSTSSDDLTEPIYGTRKRKKRDANYFLSGKKFRDDRKKRRTSSTTSSDAEDVLRIYRQNRIRRSRLCHHRLTSPNDFYLSSSASKKKKFQRRRDKSNNDSNEFFRKQNFIRHDDGWDSKRENNLSITQISEESKCYINDLPEEIILKIFDYLPLGSLVHTIPQVCKKWEILALDWSLWKGVENITIENMVISTVKLRALLRTIPNLKRLELILRNDIEELLDELFETNQKLEFLKLDRCYRSALQMNILSQTVTSILEYCPNLKTVVLTDTYFHGKNFYKCLARKFRTMERINVTCTTKSEMDVFMQNLIENIPEVEFQRVPMMGRADGKQIYWGPILGLVVRPIPTSPFYNRASYPNYAF